MILGRARFGTLGSVLRNVTCWVSWAFQLDLSEEAPEAQTKLDGRSCVDLQQALSQYVVETMVLSLQQVSHRDWVA